MVEIVETENGPILVLYIKATCPECNEKHTCPLELRPSDVLDLTTTYQIKCDHCIRRSKIHLVGSERVGG